MDEFFRDMQVTPDLLIHRVDIYRTSSSVDEAGGRAKGTTAAEPQIVEAQVPCLIVCMPAEDVESWESIGLRSSHTLYFGRHILLKKDDIFVRKALDGDEYLRLTAFDDELEQGIITTVRAITYQRGIS